VDLDGLLFPFDVIPATKRFPALRHDLDLNLASQNIRNFYDSIVVRLDIHLRLLFFSQQSPLRESHVHTGILDRLILLAGRDLNA